MSETLALAGELERRGEAYAWATVVRVQPPVSARPADHAVVVADGTLVGWIGGSCSQPLVVREALTAMAEGRPRLLRIRPAGGAADDAEGIVTEVTTCASEGGLDVFIEPRRPQPKVAVAGASPVAETLGQLLAVLGHRVVQVAEEERLAELAQAGLGPRDAVVVATMNRYDEIALGAALDTGAGYVGLVASRRRAARVLAGLQAAGIAESSLARVKAPAGLDLGPSTQPEIAVSILAELVGHWHVPAAPAVAPGQPAATDPVCGMRVAVTAQALQAAYGGRQLYFCCAGCRRAFIADPAGYLADRH